MGVGVPRSTDCTSDFRGGICILFMLFRSHIQALIIVLRNDYAVKMIMRQMNLQRGFWL